MSSPSRTVETGDASSTDAALVLVGEHESTTEIASALSNLQAPVEHVADATTLGAEAVRDRLAIILSCVGRSRGLPRTVSELRSLSDLPVYAIIGDDASPRLAPALYGGGAAGVFAWPSERSTFARYLAEMLALRRVRGSAEDADAALARTVRAHLRHLSTAGGVNHVEADAGTVFLEGSVEKLVERDGIVDRVAAIPGVLDVVSRDLIVIPESIPDREIQRTCNALAALEKEAGSAPIQVTVRSGQVRFEGKVHDRRIRHRLREATAHLRGVRAVDVAIEVIEGPTRANDQIRKSLEGLVSGLIKDSRIEVRFYKGVVVLEGRVKTLQQRRLIQDFVERERAVSTVVNKIQVDAAHESNKGSAESPAQPDS